MVGLACAAAIATDRYRRGDHRAFVAAWGETEIATWSLTFHKGLRERAGEENVVSRLIVQALSEFSGLRPELELGLTDGDLLEVERIARPEPLDELLAGDVRWVVRHPDGAMEAEGEGSSGDAAWFFQPAALGAPGDDGGSYPRSPRPSS